MQVDLNSTYCSSEGCGVIATFGYPGSKAERCRAHVLDGMVRIKSHTKLKQAPHPMCVCSFYVPCALHGAKSHVIK